MCCIFFLHDATLTNSCQHFGGLFASLQIRSKGEKGLGVEISSPKVTKRRKKQQQLLEAMQKKIEVTLISGNHMNCGFFPLLLRDVVLMKRAHLPPTKKDA